LELAPNTTMLFRILLLDSGHHLLPTDRFDGYAPFSQHQLRKRFKKRLLDMADQIELQAAPSGYLTLTTSDVDTMRERSAERKAESSSSVDSILKSTSTIDIPLTMTQHNIVVQPQRANNASLDERPWVTQQHATTHDTTTTTTIQVNSVQRLNALLGALANQLPNVPSIIYGAWETPTQHRSVITQETYSHSKFLQELLRVLKTMPGYDSNFNFTTLEILFNGEFGQGRDLNHHGALLVTTIGDNKRKWYSTCQSPTGSNSQCHCLHRRSILSRDST